MDITEDARAIVHHLHHDTFPWGPRELLKCSRFINILEINRNCLISPVAETNEVEFFNKRNMYNMHRFNFLLSTNKSRCSMQNNTI